MAKVQLRLNRHAGAVTAAGTVSFERTSVPQPSPRAPLRLWQYRQVMQGIAMLSLYCGLLALAGVASAQPAAGRNPLLAESSLPFNYPPFDLIRDEHFLPAFEQGMDERLAQVQVIAGSADAPTFDNTIVALERAGALLRGRRSSSA